MSIARMIYASPDLLQALKFALPYVEFSAAHPKSGVQGSSARADVAIIKDAISIRELNPRVESLEPPPAPEDEA